MKNSLRIDKDPSGMSNAGLEKYEKMVMRLQMKPIGRVSNPRGDIFVAERLVSTVHGWEVAWAARDMVSSLDFPFATTQKQRLAEAVAMAQSAIETLDNVERPTH